MTEIPPAPSPVNGEEDSAEGHLMRGRGADTERAEGDDDSAEGHLMRGRGADAERTEGDDDSAEGHVFRPSAKPPT